MLGRVRQWLSSLVSSDGDADSEGSAGAEDTDESGLSRFVPSVLDASVRYSHGGSNPEGERALAEIDEEARRLEEQQRK